MTRKAKKQAYVVFKGSSPGIYYEWKECEAQIARFPGNKFQGYVTRAQAEQEWDQYQQSLRLENAPPPQDADANVASPAKRPRTIESIRAFRRDEEAPKREVTTTNISDEEEEQSPRRKKPKIAAHSFDSQQDFINLDDLEEKPTFALTDAQQAVVELAVEGHNIFLTGAAGSGKTATLKEILKRLRRKYSIDSAVQVIAPTGIAALPLDGKTTYSFAGWYVVFRFCACLFHQLLPI